MITKHFKQHRGHVHHANDPVHDETCILLGAAARLENSCSLFTPVNNKNTFWDWIGAMYNFKWEVE